MKKLQQTQHKYASPLILFPQFEIKMITCPKNPLKLRASQETSGAKNEMLKALYYLLIHLTTLTFDNIIRSIEFAVFN